jgi:hypothetical protein
VPEIETQEYIKDLPDGFAIYFRVKRVGSEILSFAAALIKEGQCITRYDNAHGFAHRDVLGKRRARTIRRETFPQLTLKQVLEYAENNLTQNYGKHYEEYQSQ